MTLNCQTKKPQQQIGVIFHHQKNKISKCGRMIARLGTVVVLDIFFFM
jgi:hypothetical protein